MKKIILLSLVFISCGSVKKTQEKTETTIDLTRYSKSLTLEPVNLEKPILIGKDTVYNTRVIYNNSKEIVKEVEQKEVATKEKDYSELIDSLSNKILIFLLIIFVIYWFKNYIR